MMGMKIVHDQNRRSVLKAFSWRIIATSTGMLLVYLFTGKSELTAGFGIGDFTLKMIFYFLHERAWNQISFGKTLTVTVKSALRSPPLTVLPTERVSSVIKKMIDFDIGAAIVSKGDDLLGLITERDILDRVFKAGSTPSKIFAKDIMSSPVISTEYSKQLIDMLKEMRSKKVRRLLVTKYGKLKGIVTERRLFKALV